MSEDHVLIYVKTPVQVSVEDGMFHVRFDHIAELVLTPHRFRLTAQAFAKAVEQFDQAQRAKAPVALESRRRRPPTDESG